MVVFAAGAVAAVKLATLEEEVEEVGEEEEEEKAAVGCSTVEDKRDHHSVVQQMRCYVREPNRQWVAREGSN